MDNPAMIMLGLFAIIAMFWLFFLIKDIADERERERRLAAMDSDIECDAHLARLEEELEMLKRRFGVSG